MGKKNRRRATSKQGAAAPASSTNGATAEGNFASVPADANASIAPASSSRSTEEEEKEKIEALQRQLLDSFSRCSGDLEATDMLTFQMFRTVGIDQRAYDTDPFSDGDQSKLKSSAGLHELWYMKQPAAFGLCLAEALKRMDQKIPRQTTETVDDYIRRLSKVQEPALAATTVVDTNRRETKGFSDFALFCAVGNAFMVEKILLSTAVNSKERYQLLERRESPFRLSPLLLAVKHVTLLHETQGNWDEVVHTLLAFGACPFARDILGRTVVHYATDGKLLDAAKFPRFLQLSSVNVLLCFSHRPSNILQL